MAAEDVRERVRGQLEEMFGVDGATYLMDRPPGGWSDLATHRDIDLLASNLDLKLEAFETRLMTRMDTLETRLDSKIDTLETRLDSKIDTLETRLDSKIDTLEARLDSKIDTRIADVFTKQTRWLVTTLLASLGVLGGAMIAAIRL